MLKAILLLLFLSAIVARGEESHLLYLIHKGESTAAFSLYREAVKKEGSHDYKLLQRASLALLEEGCKNKEKEVVLLSLLGAGVSLHKEALSILRQGLSSKEPEVQLTALHLLCRFDEEETLHLLREALNSPHLLIRLEAMLFLASEQELTVVDHLYSLYGKVPEEVKILFPQILTLIDSPASTAFLRKLLAENAYKIRLATLLEVAKKERDDLLPSVRALATHPGFAEEEACAFALGKLRDREAEAQLMRLSERTQGEVSVAALKALYDIGHPEALAKLVQKAREENLFALQLLGEVDAQKEIHNQLLNLLESPNPSVRLNSAFLLMRFQEKKALAYFYKLFERKKEDVGFYRQRSPGKALFYWKAVPSYSQKIKNAPLLAEENRIFFSQMVQAALEFAEEDFLPFLKMIIENHEYSEFIPFVMELLCNHPTDPVIAFLKQESQATGAPLLRYFSLLTLYRLNKESCYETPLLTFLEEQKGKELHFGATKSLLNSEEEELPSRYSMTSEESSALRIAIFEMLAVSHSEKILDLLIDAIAYGNPKNRYALAGLLIRITE